MPIFFTCRKVHTHTHTHSWACCKVWQAMPATCPLQLLLLFTSSHLVYKNWNANVILKRLAKERGGEKESGSETERRRRGRDANRKTCQTCLAHCPIDLSRLYLPSPVAAHTHTQTHKSLFCCCCSFSFFTVNSCWLRQLLPATSCCYCPLPSPTTSSSVSHFCPWHWLIKGYAAPSCLSVRLPTAIDFFVVVHPSENRDETFNCATFDLWRVQQRRLH